MSDEKLRELERRFKETGSVEDEAAWLKERVRVGDLTQERLELAAYCGHAPAALVSQYWEYMDFSDPRALLLALRKHGISVVRIAITAAATATLPAYRGDQLSLLESLCELGRTAANGPNQDVVAELSDRAWEADEASDSAPDDRSYAVTQAVYQACQACFVSDPTENCALEGMEAAIRVRGAESLRPAVTQALVHWALRPNSTT